MLGIKFNSRWHRDKESGKKADKSFLLGIGVLTLKHRLKISKNFQQICFKNTQFKNTQ
jgi:hypothetical protein